MDEENNNVFGVTANNSENISINQPAINNDPIVKTFENEQAAPNSIDSVNAPADFMSAENIMQPVQSFEQGEANMPMQPKADPMQELNQTIESIEKIRTEEQIDPNYNLNYNANAPSDRIMVQQVAQNPVQEFVQQPVQNPVQEFAQQPVQNPVQEFAQQPVQNPMQQFAQQPVQNPMQQFAQQPVQNPMQQFAQQLAQQPEQQQTQEPNKEKKNGSNKIFVIAVVVLLVIAVGLGIVLYIKIQENSIPTAESSYVGSTSSNIELYSSASSSIADDNENEDAVNSYNKALTNNTGASENTTSSSKSNKVKSNSISNTVKNSVKTSNTVSGNVVNN